jgi:hypothetical protein
MKFPQNLNFSKWEAAELTGNNYFSIRIAVNIKAWLICWNLPSHRQSTMFSTS